jgi:hypothetical protein
MTNPPFSEDPENLLERSLLEAFGDESVRPEFYRRLLAAQIHVVPVGGTPAVEGGVVKTGETIRFQSVEIERVSCTAFYSSENRLREANPGQTDFLCLSAAAFFKLTKGSRLVMNPGLPFCKEFQPGEIEAVLDGRIFGNVEPHRVQEDREILIGQPDSYPYELVAALSRLFKRYKSVRKAYLAQYADSARDPAPGLMICVDMDAVGDWAAVKNDSSAMISPVQHAYKFVDFVLYEPKGGGISTYFVDRVKPFYERSV